VNKKVLMSFFTIGMVLAAVGGATYSYFSDTETSTGNTFSAGTIDISVDGENPWESSHQYVLEDLKPSETRYIEFTVRNEGSNPVVLRKRIVVTDESTGLQSEPECDAEHGDWDQSTKTCSNMTAEDNEISKEIHYDMDVDGVTLIPEDWGVMVSDINSVWIPLGTLDVGESVTIKQSYHLDADAGNEFQGDVMTFNIELYGEQRLGPGPDVSASVGGLVLENKTGDPDWYSIVDGTWGLLTWDASGNYTFHGFGLDTGTSYRLVYWDGSSENPLAGGAYTAPNPDGSLTLTGTYPGLMTNTDAKYWLRPDDWSNSKTLWEGNLIN